MSAYILRRLLYAIPILLGVNLITFALFFVVNSPDDMARMQLGQKRVTPEAMERWKREHGYDAPLLFNTAAAGTGKVTETIFFQKSLRLFLFDFGRSDSGRDIGHDIAQRMWPSLAIAVPSLLVGLLVNLSFALLIVFCQGRDGWAGRCRLWAEARGWSGAERKKTFPAQEPVSSNTEIFTGAWFYAWIYHNCFNLLVSRVLRICISAQASPRWSG